MKNSKLRGKQKVDVRYAWKGETRYKSLCQSHVSKIKSFLPVAAVTSLTKVWTDGQTDGRTDGQGDSNIAPTQPPLYEWGYYEWGYNKIFKYSKVQVTIESPLSPWTHPKHTNKARPSLLHEQYNWQQYSTLQHVWTMYIFRLLSTNFVISRIL